jgi:two pore calcium channel protein 1
MNLMLAVVYETFTGIEKDKFRKLLLHKRKACQLAFRLLVSKQTPNMVRFKQFHGLMRYYSRRTSQRDIILIFRQLNTSGTGALTEDEFLGIYDAITLRWRLKDPPDPWFSAAWPPLRMFCRAARTVVTWEYFEHIVCTSCPSNKPTPSHNLFARCPHHRKRSGHVHSSPRIVRLAGRGR